MPDEKLVHDPQVLRAIAHPVRNRILSELDAQGSLRAADIARELGIPANQASFHLRQLAKYGLVEEDPGAAHDRRDRVWKASSDSGLTINLKQLEAAPGGPAAARVFRRNAAAWGHVVVEQIHSSDRAEGVHSSLNQTALRLTDTEARKFAGELGEVVERWSARTQGKRDAGRSTYLYYGAVLPYPDLPED